MNLKKDKNKRKEVIIRKERIQREKPNRNKIVEKQKKKELQTKVA